MTKHKLKQKVSGIAEHIAYALLDAYFVPDAVVSTALDSFFSIILPVYTDVKYSIT